MKIIMSTLYLFFGLFFCQIKLHAALENNDGMHNFVDFFGKDQRLLLDVEEMRRSHNSMYAVVLFVDDKDGQGDITSTPLPKELDDQLLRLLAQVKPNTCVRELMKWNYNVLKDLRGYSRLETIYSGRICLSERNKLVFSKESLTQQEVIQEIYDPAARSENVLLYSFCAAGMIFVIVFYLFS